MKFLVSAPRPDGSRLAYLTAASGDGTPIAEDFAVVREFGAAAERGGWVRVGAALQGEGKPFPLFPKRVDLLIHPARGWLRIHGDKKLWAEFARDAAASRAIV